VLFGESLGCAVALELAIARPAAALLLEAPFTSVRTSRGDDLRSPPFVRTRYESLGGPPAPHAAVRQGPEIIPPAGRLFEPPEPKRCFAIPGEPQRHGFAVSGAYWRVSGSGRRGGGGAAATSENSWWIPSG
jgi:pimeloyl-ACP methyl ester carboxylesterase